MKDKKFVTFVALAIVWLLLFAGTAMGELKVNPRLEQMATVIVLLWGAYWTISMMWPKKKNSTEEKEQTNASEKETTKP